MADSPYDALLTASPQPQASPYDALVAATSPAQSSSPYDALVSAAQQTAPQSSSPAASDQLTVVDASAIPNLPIQGGQPAFAAGKQEREAADIAESIKFVNEPLVTLPKPTGTGVIPSVTRAVEQNVEGLISPSNLALIPALGAAPRIGSALLTAYMGSQLPAAKEAIGNANTPGERAESITNFLFAAGMTGAAGSHFLGEHAPALRDAGMPQEEIDRISGQLKQGALEFNQKQLAPETPYAQEPGRTVGADIVDGLTTAKQRLLSGFSDASPEDQKSRQSQLDEIESQLLQISREQVNESAARVAEQGQPKATAAVAAPAIEATPSSADNKGTSELFNIAKQEQQAAPPVAESAPATTAAVAEAPSAPLSADQTGGVTQPETTAEAPVAPAEGRTNPMDQLRQLEADAQASPVDAKAEKMVSVLQKLGRVNRDSTKAVQDELRYYSDDELAQLKDHLGAKDADPGTIAKAITGRDALKETERPSDYRDEPGGEEGRGHPTQDVAKEAFGEDYVGGPGAMGPREAAALEANRRKLSITNASVNERRVAEGNLKLLNEYRQSNPDTLETAERRMEADPKYVDNVIDGLRNGSKESVSHVEEAALTYEMVRVKNLRDQWAERASDPNVPEIERSEAHDEWQKHEDRLNEIDQATKIAGTSAGRALQIRQMQLYDDLTHAGIERQARAKKGESLSPEESAKFQKLSDEYKALQEHASKMEQAASEGEAHAEMARIYEAEIRDIQREAAKHPKISKPVLEVARCIVDRWSKEAMEARDSLKNFFGSESGGVGGVGGGKGGRKMGERTPAEQNAIAALAKVIRAHIGEVGLKLAEVTKRVNDEFGDKAKPFIKEAWKRAKKLIDDEKTPPKVKEQVKRTGAGKREQTTGDVKAKLKADAKAGDELSHKYVSDLVRAHIKAGVHGEDAVMAAVHKDVQEAYPDATERDVRRAYTEYGNVKFPSKEAVATEMRELRTLTRLQESIDRETEGLDSLHTGLQRDKATQSIREKQAKLNELLKKRQGPPSPEKLASRDEAKQTALRNAIADLDKQLRTGEKPVKGEPAPDSDATEQLRAERDAMRDKLREIDEAAKPKQSEAEKQVEQLGKQRQKIDDILAGKTEKTAPKPFEALSKEADNLKAEIQSMHELAAQMRRDAKPKTDPNYAQEQATIKRFEDAAKRYQEKLDAGDFSTKEKNVSRPDTEKVAAARAVMDARRTAYEAAKKAGKPVRTPEQIYNETRMKAIAKEMKALQEKLDTGNLAPTPKLIPKEKFASTAKAESDLRAKRQEIKSAIEGINYANRTVPRKVIDAFKSALHFITAVKIIGHGTVGIMNHAGGLAYRPTKAAIYWKNFGRQWGMWLNKPMHEQLVYNLVHDPYFETWKKAGASIDPEKTYTDYGMYAKWIGKVGAAGSRGFDALKLTRLELNKADWDKVPDSIKSDPEAATNARKMIAEINNKATGTIARDNSAISQAARNPVADAILFAPKLYASRWSRALLDPIKTADTFLDWKNASAADRLGATMRVKHAAEFAGTYVAALLMNQAILSATGSQQKVNLNDPTKSDWLKFKAGNKQIIADGGLLDPVRLLGKIVWGDLLKPRTRNEQYREGSRFDKAGHDLLSYLRGKLNPTLGLVTDVATQSDFQGRPLPFSNDQPKFKDQPKYNWGEWLMKQGPIPLSGGVQVAYDEMRKNGMTHLQAMDILKGAAISLVGTTGVHVNEDYMKNR